MEIAPIRRHSPARSLYESNSKGFIDMSTTSVPSQGFTLWFTGLSGAGKSTVANLVAARLREQGRKVEILDGDVICTNLSKGLGFSREDRDTNVRRIGYVAELLSRNDVVTIVAAISPFREIRDEIRTKIGNFVEVHADCTLDVLVQRDVKGLYAKALRGEIAQFTGVSDPYEAPLQPEVRFASDQETPEQSTERILSALQELGYVQEAVASYR